MKKEMERNIVTEDMEYLKNLLHKEWERSGITMAKVVFPANRIKTVNKKIMAVIETNRIEIENGEFTFRQSMEITKECYLLLRFAKKVKRAEEKVKKETDKKVMVELDREEYKVFQCLFQTEGRS